MTSAPFGPNTTSMWSRILRYGAGILVLAATVGLVRHFTQVAPGAAASSTDTMVMSPVAGAERAVHLSDADQQRIGVTFATAEVGALRREIRTVAQVVIDETRMSAVTLKIDGWVDRLDVNAPGAAVRKGDPLLAVYSPMLITAQQELLLAHRLAAEVAGGSTGTRAGAAELYAAAQHRLQQWDVPSSELEAIERDGAEHRAVTFLAPASGVIVEKNVVQGQRIMVGEVLYRIADLSHVWLDGEVFGEDLPEVHIGQDVTAEFAALPGETRHGRIGFIYPTLDPETRTAHVRVELANPGMLLKPGMYATIRFNSTRDGALTVPRSSVLTTGERSIVFVRDTDGRFVARDVALGESTDERIEILRGLTAGEVVVASGTFLVDAESNLDKTFGGMGNMPGMDMKPAPTPTKGSKGLGGVP